MIRLLDYAPATAASTWRAARPIPTAKVIGTPTHKKLALLHRPPAPKAKLYAPPTAPLPLPHRAPRVPAVTCAITPLPRLCATAFCAQRTGVTKGRAEPVTTWSMAYAVHCHHSRHESSPRTRKPRCTMRAGRWEHSENRSSFRELVGSTFNATPFPKHTTEDLSQGPGRRQALAFGGALKGARMACAAWRTGNRTGELMTTHGICVCVALTYAPPQPARTLLNEAWRALAFGFD